jgi:hypothetical protein
MREFPVSVLELFSQFIGNALTAVQLEVAESQTHLHVVEFVHSRWSKGEPVL